MGHAPSHLERDDRHKAIVAAVRGGMTRLEASARFGLSHAAVSRACKAAGITANDAKKRTSEMEAVFRLVFDDWQQMIGGAFRTKQQTALHAKAKNLLQV